MFYNEDDYEHEYEEMRRLFPNAKFDICVGLGELDDVLSHDDNICIMITHNCYYYTNCPREIDCIIVHNTSGNGKTNANAIRAMIEYNYDSECSHCFFEGFEQIRVDDNNLPVFKAYFGS
jgi:hypothetical protein